MMFIINEREFIMNLTEWSSIVMMLAITGYGVTQTLTGTLLTVLTGVAVLGFLWKS